MLSKDYSLTHEQDRAKRRSMFKTSRCCTCRETGKLFILYHCLPMLSSFRAFQLLKQGCFQSSKVLCAVYEHTQLTHYDLWPHPYQHLCCFETVLSMLPQGRLLHQLLILTRVLSTSIVPWQNSIFFKSFPHHIQS